MAEDDRGGDDSRWRRLRIFSILTCRNWFVVGAVLLLFTVIFVAVSISLFGQKSEPSREPYAAFSASLDGSVDPCHNFYDFACGLWHEKRPASSNAFLELQEVVNERKADIFREASANPDLPDAVNAAITFYKTCMARNFSRNDYDALNDSLAAVGGWPVRNDSGWDENSFDWLNASAFYQRDFELDIVFRMSMYALPNSTQIFIKQPLSLNPYAAMLDVILLPILLNINCPNKEILYAVISKAHDNWNKLLGGAVDAADEMIVSIEDLMEQFPSIDFFRYFNMRFQDSLMAENISLTLQDIVVVDNINYLRKVDLLLNSDAFSSFELANLFGYFLAEKIWVLIPGVLETYGAQFDLDAEEVIYVAQRNCYEKTEEMFGSSVDYLYVKHHWSPETMDKIKLVSNYVQQAFHKTVVNSEWLDEESRVSALKTLDEMRKIIGFPSYLTNKTEFDLLHDSLPVLSRNILESYIAFKKLGHFSHHILPRSVTDVSIYYISNKNTVVFPISVHNSPFFYRNGPSYLNFGSMGALIGHEIMHAFGSFDDAFSYRRDFETEVCNAAFKNLTQCFIEQFDEYVTNSTLSRGGAHTLRENVADTEGLRVSFLAHKQYEADNGPDAEVKDYGNYTSDQMFFISFATVWCSKIVPNQYNIPHNLPNVRLNGAVSNLRSFARAFSCRDNSPMNPQKKCLIW